MENSKALKELKKNKKNNRMEGVRELSGTLNNRQGLDELGNDKGGPSEDLPKPVKRTVSFPKKNKKVPRRWTQQTLWNNT